MKNLLIAAFVLAALTGSANAVQPITWDQDGIDSMIHGKRQHTPAMDELQGVADGTCSAAECFDGNPIIRHEEPGLVILKEKFVRYQHPRRHGGKEGGDFTPAKYVYKQTVGIADREKYVAGSKSGGKVGGGIVGGLLGGLGVGLLVALFTVAAPLAIVAVTGGVVAGAFNGATIGGNIAGKDAVNKPKIFERMQEYETKPSA